MSAIGAALQRPVDIKANPSCFKEPISDVVGHLLSRSNPMMGGQASLLIAEPWCLKGPKISLVVWPMRDF